MNGLSKISSTIYTTRNKHIYITIGIVLDKIWEKLKFGSGLWGLVSSNCTFNLIGNISSLL